MKIFYNKSFFTRKLNIKTHIKKKKKKNHKLFFSCYFHFPSKEKYFNDGKFFFNMNLKLKLLGNRKMSFFINISFLNRICLVNKTI